MKILFVTMTPLEYNSSAIIQNKGFIRGIKELGYNIDTITLKPKKNIFTSDAPTNIDNSYYFEMNKLYSKYTSKKNTSEKYDMKKKSDKKKNTFLEKAKKNMKNIYNKITVFDTLKINVKEISKLKIDYSKYDVIVSSSDPKSSHLLVERIFLKNKDCNAEWIQYWGDPMLHDITRTNNWIDKSVKHHEEKILSKADKIIYVSPLTLNLQKETYPNLANKMFYASQPYVIEPDNTNVITNNNPLIFSYYGEYTSTVRNIIPLYKVARKNNVMLNIGGSTDLNLNETTNIKIEDQLSYKEVLIRENSSDVLIAICNLRGTQIPAKIYYTAGYNKPIIVILDGEYTEELRKHFESFNRYILCNNNEKSIKNALKIAENQINNISFEGINILNPKYIAKKILKT